jgi:hypothetical protein
MLITLTSTDKNVSIIFITVTLHSISNILLQTFGSKLVYFHNKYKFTLKYGTNKERVPTKTKTHKRKDMGNDAKTSLMKTWSESTSFD